MEFERESATMDMKEEMMSDAVDDVMEDDLEDEEEEGDKILKQVLDEIGVDLSQQVRHPCSIVVDSILSSLVVQLTEAPNGLAISSPLTEPKQAVALGGPSGGSTTGGGPASGGGDDMSDEDALQARLDALRRG